MGQLYSLTQYKRDLTRLIDKLTLESIILEKARLIKDFHSNQSFLSVDNLRFDSKINEILSSYENLVMANNNNISQIRQLITQVTDVIKTIAAEVVNRPEYLSRWTTSAIRPGSNLPSTKEFEELLSLKISSYCEWRFPGLMMCRYMDRENIEKIDVRQTYSDIRDQINSMVASDPLYLLGGVDQHKAYIDHFPEVYQSRLRLYNNIDFSRMPHAQFGFVLCWDYLNYLHEGEIEFYLTNIIKLLRPGGTVIFSYNNCEYLESANLVETNRAAWSTESDIILLLERIGYTVSKTNNYPLGDVENTVISFIEARKPGELSTVKLSQAMGEIVQK